MLCSPTIATRCGTKPQQALGCGDGTGGLWCDGGDGLVALPIDGETEMGWDDSVVPSMKGLKLQIEITDLPLTEKNRSR